MTIHDFDMARFISGSDIVEVHAAVGAALVDPAIGEIGDVDTSVVVLRHASGCLTVIDNSRQAVYGYDQRVEALGTAGLAVSENPPRHSAVIADDRSIGGAVLADSFIDRYETSFVRQWQSFVGNVGPARRRSAGTMPVPLVAGLAASSRWRPAARCGSRPPQRFYVGVSGTVSDSEAHRSDQGRLWSQSGRWLNGDRPRVPDDEFDGLGGTCGRLRDPYGDQLNLDQLGVVAGVDHRHGQRATCSTSRRWLRRLEPALVLAATPAACAQVAPGDVGRIRRTT